MRNKKLPKSHKHGKGLFVFFRSSSGFTLAEMLVAMAVLALLLTLLMGMVSSATSLWRQAENRADAYREARAALSLLARDFSTAWGRDRNSFVWGSESSILLSGDAAETYNQGKKRDAVFFLTTMPPSAQEYNANSSDVCRVGYFLAFDTTSMSPGNSQPSMNLYRYFSGSNATFESLKNSGTNPFDMGILPNDRNCDLLAKNVREFSVRPLKYTTGGAFTTFIPSDANPLPDAVEIEIPAIHNEAAKKFPQKEHWVNDPPDILTQGEQKFSVRVRLPARQ